MQILTHNIENNIDFNLVCICDAKHKYSYYIIGDIKIMKYIFFIEMGTNL